VSLPFFIPAPPPIFLFGTMGAVIRMRSPARDRNSLFDIAAAGPLAGLVVAVPALLLGLSWSRVGMVLPEHSGITFGDSLLMRLLDRMVFGPSRRGWTSSCTGRPRGWVGLFVTALNLFPVGQLDGAAHRVRPRRRGTARCPSPPRGLRARRVFQRRRTDRFGALILLLAASTTRRRRRPHPAVAAAAVPRGLLPDPADRPDPGRSHLTSCQVRIATFPTCVFRLAYQMSMQD
jgi:hypothetical protein